MKPRSAGHLHVGPLEAASPRRSSTKTMLKKIYESPAVLTELFLHIQGEPDRGAVLSAAAALDDLLEELIANFLRDNSSSKKLLDGFNAPLGTFSSRILMANALGLLTVEEHEDLGTIRRIRNYLAHKWSDVSFSTDELCSLALNLKLAAVTIPMDRSNARNRFNSAFAVICTSLISRAGCIEHLGTHPLVYR